MTYLRNALGAPQEGDEDYDEGDEKLYEEDDDMEGEFDEEDEDE